MGLFDELVDRLKTELEISKELNAPRVVASQQTPEDRKALIEADRERFRVAELNKPFELEGSL